MAHFGDRDRIEVKRDRVNAHPYWSVDIYDCGHACVVAILANTTLTSLDIVYQLPTPKSYFLSFVR